ncbi:hypothetical protein EJ08DRAFT_684376 [Tothia fuscella]|uniref:F-box domain-containing protein n=1 Tax=Tothia fuscella TaxID=1048955 RepID=A0A9P4NDW9_9PEZI|nr:hypothetical protein EJ08DRAFT_684376 [Tothia fuscella]
MVTKFDDGTDISLTFRERREMRDATQTLLASRLGHFEPPRLPPLNADPILQNELFTTYSQRNKPQYLQSASTSDLRSQRFWRTTIKQQTVYLPSLLKALMKRNQSLPLQKLPVEILEIVDSNLRTPDRIALRLISRMLFTRLSTPVKANDDISDFLELLRNDNAFKKITEFEERDCLRIVRIGQQSGQDVVVSFSTGSWCRACHQTSFFSLDELLKPTFERRCVGAGRTIQTGSGKQYSLEALKHARYGRIPGQSGTYVGPFRSDCCDPLLMSIHFRADPWPVVSEERDISLIENTACPNYCRITLTIPRVLNDPQKPPWYSSTSALHYITKLSFHDASHPVWLQATAKGREDEGA